MGCSKDADKPEVRTSAESPVKTRASISEMRSSLERARVGRYSVIRLMAVRGMAWSSDDESIDEDGSASSVSEKGQGPVSLAFALVQRILIRD
jgi:hypothetical protein